MNKELFTSNKSDHETPQELFDYLNKRFSFTLDPCCTEQTAKCSKFYTKEDDGLSKSWEGERVFMNPPYGKSISRWVDKARTEASKGCLVVGLLPARVDTKWWHTSVATHSEVHFIKGRLKFSNSKNSAPFPSAIVIWWK